jgi:CRP-like cAMP-binding protein
MDEPESYFELFKNDEQKISYGTGDVVFQEGAPGSEMYVVLSGTVMMRSGGELLETIEAGGIFGEMALVDQAPRSATATAANECELVRINQKRFEFFLKRVPYFALEVMKVMATRLRRQTPSR